MNTYSVAIVSKMLNVNEETVRRRIRDGKLKADRAVGRGGNTISLQDVVDFANKPPRTYLIFLEEWLDDHKIPYERIEDSKIVDELKNLGGAAIAGEMIAAAVPAITTPAIPSALAAAGMATAATAVSLAGPIGAGAAGLLYGATKLAKRKKQRTYSIRLKNEEKEQTEIQNAIVTDETVKNPSLAQSDYMVSEMNQVEQYREEVNDDEALEKIPSTNENETDNVLDKIAKAKQMLDEGIITLEEFTIIKTRLIDKI